MTTLLVCHYFTSYLIHYFYNSKTRCDRQKQIAFLKSALKSTSIKKEKEIKIDICNYRNNTETAFVGQTYFFIYENNKLDRP